MSQAPKIVAAPALALLAVLAFVLAPAPAAQQSKGAGEQTTEAQVDEWFDPQFGRATILRPEFTDKGRWPGTWFYASRDVRVMVWMRENDAGEPEFKLQLFNMNAPEQFVTDWSGEATYELQGNPGRFALTPVEVGPDVIRARWEWEVEFPDSGRHETADVTLRRTADGRRFAMTFENLRRDVRRFDRVKTYEFPQVWTFSKASKRLILWDELF